MYRDTRFMTVALLVMLAGCVAQPPTKAHVHIGHSMTGAYNTPGEVGYFTVAEQRADEALQAAQKAVRANRVNDTAETKSSLESVQTAVISGDNFSLAEALQEAVSHIKYAASSEDASANVVTSARQLESDVKDVVERIGLIRLYLEDALLTDDSAELRYYVDEIERLCRANVQGIDVDGSGTVGDSPSELGLRQMRQSLQAMINREDPPYSTVERWYLFNLVRLEDGRWEFRSVRAGESRGY